MAYTLANATLHDNFHDTTRIKLQILMCWCACCFSLMSMTLLLIPLLLRLLCFLLLLCFLPILLLFVGNLLLLCPELVQNAISWTLFFLLLHLTPGVSVFCHGWRRLKVVTVKLKVQRKYLKVVASAESTKRTVKYKL